MQDPSLFFVGGVSESAKAGTMGWMKLVDTKEAAARLGVSEQRVRQFCEEGRLGRKFAGRWMITGAELRAFKLRPKGRPKKSSDS